MALKKRGDERILEVNASMQGELTFKDEVNLTINGSFQGKLNTRGFLLIGEKAYVKATILGEEITIAGRVEGNVIAERRLKLIPPANVIGEIKTPLLVVEEGAVLNGNCIMRSEGDNYLSLEEMASYLQIDRETLLKWAEENKVPARKEGEKYFFHREAVENWLSKEKVT